MTSRTRAGLLAVMLTIGAVTSASGAKTPVYILSGFSFGAIPGVDTAELEALLPQKAGARITPADVTADTAVIAAALKARHVQGRLLASLAEKNGRVWVIFDLLDPGARERRFWAVGQHLKTQAFEGAAGVAATDLAAATGLKNGELLSPEKVDAARLAIIAAYAKATPSKTVSVRGRMQTNPKGELLLTWIITAK